MKNAAVPFHVMVKPIGPICNLACSYCFYLDKKRLYPQEKNFRMSEELLEDFIRQYIKCQPGPVVSFAWQGGEPTLRGMDFFEKAVELQNKYVPEGWQVQNAFQTNGILLNDEWCEFFKENDFLVGISIDGPAELHDVYRSDKEGHPTHKRVLNGLHLLQEHRVEYNVLCAVNNLNAMYPLEVYRFFKDEGVRYIQFIPIVEHIGSAKVSPRTVRAEDYGRFLIAVFNEWVRNDIGRVFVQVFEECVGLWMGVGPVLCTLGAICGRAMIMEHSGDLYSCDHFVSPEYKLGNIQEEALVDMVGSPKQKKFGQDKRDALPRYCRECDVRFICNGGCPKDRFLQMPDGEGGLNYLCAGYKQFFNYTAVFMREIARMVRQKRSPLFMREKMRELHSSIWKNVWRNDPCPCGSGKKYKKCCQGRQS
jgi:uncharacterized protein